MADTMRLKVSVDLYQETLRKLEGHLGDLKTQRDRIENLIGRMTGDAFSGSDIQSAIDKCRAELSAVDVAINKVQAQYNAIQAFLEQSRTTSSTLESNINSVQIPDLFK